jgi:hypothetical protein
MGTTRTARNKFPGAQDGGEGGAAVPVCGHLRFQQPVEMSKPEPDIRIKDRA